MSKKILLDIGCGTNRYEEKGFKTIGIDARKEVNPDICVDVLEGIPLEDGFANKVTMRAFFEHFGMLGREIVIKEIYRVLKKGGKLFIAVPDIEYWAGELLKAKDGYKTEFIIRKIFGGQRDIYDFHKWGYTTRNIIHFLNEHGFVLEQIDRVKPDIYVLAVKL